MSTRPTEDTRSNAEPRTVEAALSIPEVQDWIEAKREFRAAGRYLLTAQAFPMSDSSDVTPQERHVRASVKFFVMTVRMLAVFEDEYTLAEIATLDCQGPIKSQDTLYAEMSALQKNQQCLETGHDAISLLLCCLKEERDAFERITAGLPTSWTNDGDPQPSKIDLLHDWTACWTDSAGSMWTQTAIRLNVEASLCSPANVLLQGRLVLYISSPFNGSGYLLATHNLDDPETTKRVAESKFMQATGDIARIGICVAVVYLVAICRGDIDRDNMCCWLLWAYRERVLRPWFRDAFGFVNAWVLD
ncbi:hypothetical protein LXA43DRAFT_1070048 [Ganoderma leucocontextum]|nr:hypothetical protein LXA43DRAFT_1070048 [Ganoderma leucocontextum]